MRLTKLLQLADISTPLSPGQNPEIKGLNDDSRRIKPGWLFVAVKGLEHDGHDYIKEAVRNGAVAIVYEDQSKIESARWQTKSKIVPIKTDDSRKRLGLLWAAWYAWPAKKLTVIGVTGTDGKTTTANLIYRLLRGSGRKVGLVSTLNALIGGKSYETGFHVTNPEPEALQKYLRLMVDKGLKYAVLEVTSHGIEQERISGIDFAVAVVTNVTPEHLDYHKTFKNYLAVKGRLTAGSGISILNRDDASYPYLAKVAKGRVVTYGLEHAADFRAVRVRLRGGTSTFSLKPGAQPMILALPGRYNVYNALAAATTASVLGVPEEKIRSGLAGFKGLSGRFEEIKAGQPFRVVVDFAHTPNALRQVLELCSKLKDPSSRLIVVFGCAGERDKRKRPRMGSIAGRWAAIAILTAEDPRREDVNVIIDEIAGGCRKIGAKEISNLKSKISNFKKLRRRKHYYVRVPDRKRAIGLALKIAGRGDVVIITGKGHEKSMCFGATEYPWSDQAVIKEILKRGIEKSKFKRQNCNSKRLRVISSSRLNGARDLSSRTPRDDRVTFDLLFNS